jgi:hypothetical protein
MAEPDLVPVVRALPRARAQALDDDPREARSQ